MKTLITNVPNRSYDRIRIKLIGKWYYCKNYKEIIESD